MIPDKMQFLKIKGGWHINAFVTDAEFNADHPESTANFYLAYGAVSVYELTAGIKPIQPIPPIQPIQPIVSLGGEPI